MPSISSSVRLRPTVINSVGLMIDNKEYLFTCQFSDFECQFFQFENDIISNKYLREILGGVERPTSYSIFFSILNLNQNNKIILSYVYQDNLSLSIINLKKDEETDFYELVDQSSDPRDFDDLYKLDISCIVTENNFVECLVKYNRQINIEIYEINDESLNYIKSIAIDSLEEYSEDMYIYNPSYIWFVKCIHLKNEIGVFSYYFSPDEETGSPLYIQIKELRDNNLENVINNNDKFVIAIDKINYFDHISYLFYNI